MKQPGIILAGNCFFNTSVSREISKGCWVPARPVPYSAWWMRWKAAWLVFTGRADALRWIDQ